MLVKIPSSLFHLIYSLWKNCASFYDIIWWCFKKTKRKLLWVVLPNSEASISKTYQAICSWTLASSLSSSFAYATTSKHVKYKAWGFADKHQKALVWMLLSWGMVLMYRLIEQWLLPRFRDSGEGSLCHKIFLIIKTEIFLQKLQFIWIHLFKY
jgi:hypothetical protein